MRQIRNARENIVQTRVKVGCRLLESLDLLAQVFGLRHRGAGVLPALFQLGDLFRSFVALRLAGLGLGDRLPSLRVDFAKVLEHGSRIHAALAQLFFHQWQIFANKIQIKHGDYLLYRKSLAECTPDTSHQSFLREP